MNSRRQLAVTAIKQALTPSLHPQRQGQGELSLRMANFLLTFMSSAQTNETRCCEERFSNSLEIMLRKTEAAEREVQAIQSWINDAENQLHTMPTEKDIEWLEVLPCSTSITFSELENHMITYSCFALVCSLSSTICSVNLYRSLHRDYMVGFRRRSRCKRNVISFCELPQM